MLEKCTCMHVVNIIWDRKHLIGQLYCKYGNDAINGTSADLCNKRSKTRETRNAMLLRFLSQQEDEFHFPILCS